MSDNTHVFIKKPLLCNHNHAKEQHLIMYVQKYKKISTSVASMPFLVDTLFHRALKLLHIYPLLIWAIIKYLNNIK